MEKPFANNSQLHNRHGRWPGSMGVYGRLPAPARLIGHAASPSHILAVRWHLQRLSALPSHGRESTV